MLCGASAQYVLIGENICIYIIHIYFCIHTVLMYCRRKFFMHVMQVFLAGLRVHGKQSFVIIALSGIMGKRKTEGGAGEERRGAECGKKRTEKQKNIKIKRKNL